MTVHETKNANMNGEIISIYKLKVCSLCRENKYPVGTTMRPRLAVELTDEQIFWAGLKHFYSHF